MQTRLVVGEPPVSSLTEPSRTEATSSGRNQRHQNERVHELLLEACHTDNLGHIKAISDSLSVPARLFVENANHWLRFTHSAT